MCVCVHVRSSGEKAGPQIAFNWRLKLSDSLRLSCQSRCRHRRDASQRSALLTTSGNGWVWRTARGGQTDRHTNTFTDRCGAQRQAHTQARERTQLRELEQMCAGKASYFGRSDMLHCIQAPGQSNYLLVRSLSRRHVWGSNGDSCQESMARV